MIISKTKTKRQKKNKRCSKSLNVEKKKWETCQFFILKLQVWGLEKQCYHKLKCRHQEYEVIWVRGRWFPFGECWVWLAGKASMGILGANT